jgi:pimeloyl-ACP methyl ester carboxylesterase
MKPISAVVPIFFLLAVAVEAQLPPLPEARGRLIDVGGRKLHLLCTGQGSPTVVLEAGASAFAIDWTLVQRETSKSNRTCSYDRAGMGWSDESTPGTRASSAVDLHRLLAAAGESTPFVLVGASRGGLLIRAYVLEYPDDVAGLVFVDPASEDRLFTMIDGQGILIADVTPEQLKSTFPTQAVKIPRRNPQRGSPFDKLPPDLYALRIRLDEKLIASTPDSVAPDVVGESQEAERAFLARLKATRAGNNHPLGDRPTVVLSRGDEPNAEREAVHEALANLSTNSRHSIVAGAGHEIHLFQPAAVIQAIADVVKAFREKSQLPRRN